MKHLTQKLKSQRGASMLFALLVFLLCMLAGTAALTAAAANAGRYSHLEEEQRQYFSVASALDLLQARLDEEFEKKSVSIKVIYETYESWKYNETSGKMEYSSPSYGLTLDPNPKVPGQEFSYYQKLLFENCVPKEWRDRFSYDLSFLPNEFTKTYTVRLDTSTTTPEWADSLYPVTVEVKNGTDTGKYALEMHLTTDEAGGAYPLKAVWTGEAITKTETDIKTTGSPDSTGTRVTTTTLTCTLRWSAKDRSVTFE